MLRLSSGSCMLRLRAQAQHWIMHAQAWAQAQAQLQRKRRPYLTFNIDIEHWRSTLAFNIDTARHGSILTRINLDTF